MQKKYLLENHQIVITGATAGVGRSTAIAFAKEKAVVHLIARGVAGLAATRKEIENLGGVAFIHTCDISDANAIKMVIEQIELHHGPIATLVNNAMCSVFAPVAKITPEEFARVTNVTYLGHVYATLAVLVKMRERNQGKIIFVGSALAYRGIPLQAPYCAAKHAIEGFFESLRCELLHDNSKITTSLIQMPALNTPQFSWVMNKLPFTPKPMGKVYQPEVAADAILFAATHDVRQLFVGYETIKAKLANTFLPSLVDWQLGKIGYKGQQTTSPAKSDSPNNVWAPINEDRGNHGAFDNIAYAKSYVLIMQKHKLWLTLIMSIIFALLIYYCVK